MSPSRAQTLQDWLSALPFWPDQQARRAFAEDVLWQLGAVGQITPGSDLAAAVAAACISPHRADEQSALVRLASSVRDRGLIVPDPPGFEARRPTVDRATDLGHRASLLPYPGPRPFRCAEADIFFGRGLETRTLLRMLAVAHRPLVVAGAAACGKTSLVQAGLVAALSHGAWPGLAGCTRWPVTTIRPEANAGDAVDMLAKGLASTSPRAGRELSADSIAAELRRHRSALSDHLLRGLAQGPGDARWLLIVDGFEQLLSPELERERPAFLDLLRQASALERAWILLTVRAEFLGDCIELPLLRRSLEGGGLLSLPTPSPEQLRWMLRAPLQQAGRSARHVAAAIEPLVAEALSEPLPLLHLATRARDLFGQRRMDPSPPAAAPQRSFDQRCDAALAQAGDPEARALPRILSRLVSGDDGRAALARSERLVHWDQDLVARRLIDALCRPECALLRIDETPAPTVRLQHEGLLIAWRRLARWVERRGEGRRLQQRLRVEASAWAADEFSDRRLWPDELLRPARELLAETDLLAMLEADPLLGDFLTPEPDRLSAELLCSGTENMRREDIGLRLARIGDPRAGVSNRDGCPDPEWRVIPAGTVMLDGRRKRQVQSYRLATYPVTAAQFDAFLRAADGFDCPTWWQGLVRQPVYPWRAPHRGNYPATWVSWHDATAFCRWLSTRLGFEVRLPDEWEWQWAAQSGREDFVYPWGRDWLDGRANTDEAHIGRTVAVGLYPAGQSLQGVSDLAGNTWEWCRSPFDLAAAPSPPAAAASARVIRGGSWRVNRGFARSDFRLDALPEDRVGSTGFRLACALDAPRGGTGT